MVRPSRFTQTVDGAHFDGVRGSGGFHAVFRGPEKGPFDSGGILEQVTLDFGNQAARTWLITSEGPQGVEIIAKSPGAGPAQVQSLVLNDLDYVIPKGAIVKVVTGGTVPPGVAYANIYMRGGAN